MGNGTTYPFPNFIGATVEVWEWIIISFSHFNGHVIFMYAGIKVELIVALWRHMATEIWVNIGSGNGLLPDGTKPLPEPILTDQ